MLEDGTIYTGMGFGFPKTSGGEVVFNTGMVGYNETLTDPSYKGQILCMTYPLIGNYGVPSHEVFDDSGLPKYFESNKIQISGLVVNELSTIASHNDCVQSLDQWLFNEKIPGISGIDTRDLTKKIRSDGVMKGMISVSENKIENSLIVESMKSVKYDEFNFMPLVSVTEPIEYGDPLLPLIVVIDTGTKYSIIRNILKMGFKVICVSWNTPIKKILDYGPKGVVISNGPGDPKICEATIETTRGLINSSMPTLGICLGNQIIALAGGAETYKLKFGHRGQNKACTDLDTNHTYITSQNHGYGIDPDSLDDTEFDVWYVNSDDHTIEGIKHKTKPIIAVQFHPEASPGPFDCTYVFEKFKKLINQNEVKIMSANLENKNMEGKTNYQKMNR